MSIGMIKSSSSGCFVADVLGWGLMRTKGRKENEDFNSSDGMDLGCRMAFLFLARRELINMEAALIGGWTGGGGFLSSAADEANGQMDRWTTDRTCKSWQPIRAHKFLIRN
jgi:hypothetical protein